MTNATFALTAPDDDAELLLEVRFIARANRLKLVRGAIRAAAKMCGFDDAAAQGIVLAVDEACQNIIVHGYGTRADGVVIMCLFRCDGGIIVRLPLSVSSQTGKVPSATTNFEPSRSSIWLALGSS